jgi:glycosyltransferase involved in cell wall biosynthesis
VFGPRPDDDRILFYSLWSRGHNNPRYEELLPRLGRLDRYLLVRSGGRRRGSVEYRVHRAAVRLGNPALLGLAARRYRRLLTADNEQIRWFPGQVVSDVDDPTFSTREVELLRRPNLAAYVVTAERAARRFEALGVEKPWHVIPQGVSLELIDPAAVDRVRRLRKHDGTIVVGYMAAWLLTTADRDGANPLYNVDHLLALWDEIHSRAPAARLWLVGAASERLRSRCADRDDVLLLGRLPRPDALAHVANFDIALYPRTADQGIQAAKVAEYLGAGAPTVSYRYEVTADLEDAGAGVLVDTGREFVDAVVGLAADAGARGALAAAARTAGRERDWARLARRYEAEVLDRYLG